MTKEKSNDKKEANDIQKDVMEKQKKVAEFEKELVELQKKYGIELYAANAVVGAAQNQEVVPLIKIKFV